MLEIQSMNGHVMFRWRIGNSLFQTCDLHRDDLVPILQTVRARWIDNSYHTYNTAIPLHPAPGKRGDGHTFACHFVDVTSNVLKTGDPIAEQEAMTWLPLRKYFLDRLARLSFKFLTDCWQQRPAGTVGAYRCREGMIKRLVIDPNRLDLFLGQPFTSLAIESG